MRPASWDLLHVLAVRPRHHRAEKRVTLATFRPNRQQIFRRARKVFLFAYRIHERSLLYRCGRADSDRNHARSVPQASMRHVQDR